ncbi:MAG: type II secretion system protein [Synergistaceae bacterium]|nr:type II secretion system protein [Synergistaceae bacterium]
MREHKGFTLIELLIVIVVMGILGSMMMVSSNESISTARANNIISNLRNFSMAAMAFYTDSMDHFGKTPNEPAELMSYVKKYMHNEGKIPDVASYMVKNASGVWWAGYALSDADGTRVREKIEGRASSANLCGSSSATPPEKSGTAYPSYKSSNSHVWLLIRSGKK